jgi:hypothetical protein
MVFLYTLSNPGNLSERLCRDINGEEGRYIFITFHKIRLYDVVEKLDHI